MTNYFDGLVTVEAVKRHYNLLILTHHLKGSPDAPEINKQYLALLEKLNGQVDVGSDGQEHKYTFSLEMEQAIIDKLRECLNVKATRPELKILLVGRWIWLTETKKDDAKLYGKIGIGFQWNPTRQAWQWKPYKSYGKRSTKGNSDIFNKYNAREITERVSLSVKQ